MKRLKSVGLALVAVLALTAVVSASASASGSPVNTSPPSIANKSPEEGALELASPGKWTNEPTGYSYQWERCNGTGGECANISGATSAFYTVATADVGHALVVKVTAHNSAGEGSAVSSPTEPVKAVKKPEIVPNPTEESPLDFTGRSEAITLEAASGVWECTSSSMSGSFINATEARGVKITFSGCSAGIGSFTTESLRGSLGYVEEATQKIALRLAPESGSVWAKGFYLGDSLTGSVFGRLTPVNTVTKGFALGYGKTGGVQEIQHFQHPPELSQHLLWSGQQIAIQGEIHLTTANAVEIRS